MSVAISVAFKSVCRISLLALLFTGLYGCGGSSGGKSSVPASSSSSVVSSSTSTSSLQSSSISSQGISVPSDILPDDFPQDVAEFLPQLNITTENQAPVLDKANYLQATYSLVVDGEVQAEGKLEIRGRGNSTWDWPKKPYRVKLEKATELLGMPSNRHWVLLANYADKTLVRNDVALMFARNIGLEFTSRARHVEVTFNGDYQGVYQLVEHIRVGKNRVDIPELEETDTDPGVMTGGYLMELDFRMTTDFCTLSHGYQPLFCENGVNLDRAKTYCVDSAHGMSPICLDTPEELLQPEWSAQRDYITQYLLEMEAALFSDHFADPETGYAAYMDVDSAVDYYIVNELLKNVDGAVSSFYMHKKRDGKIFFGPVWDFDLALGNAGYDDVDKTYGWHIRKAPWFDRLFQDPAFEARVKTRWQQLKEEGRLELIFAYAEARARWLLIAQERNFKRWPIFYWREWYTRVVMGSYVGEVNEMLRWQRERYEWMDAQLSN